MIYRVILKIGYYENWFDFDSVNEAAAFAKTILIYQTLNEDRKVLMSEVKMMVIDPTKIELNEAEE